MATETNSTGTPDGKPAEPATTASATNDAEHGLKREIEKLREQKRGWEAEKAAREQKDKDSEAQRLAANQEFEKLATQRGEEAAAARKENEALKAQQDRVYVDAELRSKRSELVDAEDLKLFDSSTLTVEAGEVKGLEEKWADFKKRKPHLFKQTTTATGKPGAVHPGGGTQLPDIGEVDARKMTPLQWNDYVLSQRK